MGHGALGYSNHGSALTRSWTARILSFGFCAIPPFRPKNGRKDGARSSGVQQSWFRSNQVLDRANSQLWILCYPTLSPKERAKGWGTGRFFFKLSVSLGSITRPGNRGAMAPDSPGLFNCETVGDRPRETGCRLPHADFNAIRSGPIAAADLSAAPGGYAQAPLRPLRLAP